jgi:hypothetical protein
MTCTRSADDGVVLTGVKAKPLRGGLRAALTPAPGATLRPPSGAGPTRSKTS